MVTGPIATDAGVLFVRTTLCAELDVLAATLPKFKTDGAAVRLADKL